MVSLHLSRLAEDLIIYSTKEFDFVRIADTYASGSSLMPQKRNPDSLELIRGMSGLITSNLTGMMMTIKGTPSTYNKDLQFDKLYCFQAFDKLSQCLDVSVGVLQTLRLNFDKLQSALSPDLLATDWVSCEPHSELETLFISISCRSTIWCARACPSARLIITLDAL